MAKISLSPKFIKESLLLFKEKSLKEIIFGNRVILHQKWAELIDLIEKNPDELRAKDGRKGQWKRLGFVHKGTGDVYLVPNPDDPNQSILLMNDNTIITAGPDLYVYLATEQDIAKDGLGDFLDLGLLKGTKGGQVYTINQPLGQLSQFKSVVIWCKQFAVLFTFANLE